MSRFRLISLFLSSLLVMCLLSCSPVHGYKLRRKTLVTERDVQPIVNRTQSLLYKARIDVYNRSYSGLILLKQLNDSTSHLTFVTEIGMKMFDFEIRDNHFNLVYVFEPLNKPKITGMLKNDMKLVLLHQLLNREADEYERAGTRMFYVKEGFHYYYRLSENGACIENIRKKGRIFTKVRVDYFYNDSRSAAKIKLKHKGLMHLKIELNYLDKTAAL